MTRIQELYRIIDINSKAIKLIREDKQRMLASIKARIDERWEEIEKALKELDELCRI